MEVGGGGGERKVGKKGRELVEEGYFGMEGRGG